MAAATIPSAFSFALARPSSDAAVLVSLLWNCDYGTCLAKWFCTCHGKRHYNFTKYCTCYEKRHCNSTICKLILPLKMTLELDILSHLPWKVMLYNFTKYCTCHKRGILTSPSIARATKKSHYNFPKYCACHKKGPSNVTKYWTCHEEGHSNVTTY